MQNLDSMGLTNWPGTLFAGALPEGFTTPSVQNQPSTSVGGVHWVGYETGHGTNWQLSDDAPDGGIRIRYIVDVTGSAPVTHQVELLQKMICCVLIHNMNSVSLLEAVETLNDIYALQTQVNEASKRTSDSRYIGSFDPSKQGRLILSHRDR